MKHWKRLADETFPKFVLKQVRYEIVEGRCRFALVESRDRGSQADGCDYGARSVIFPKRT